jgi:hypothetical protein
MSGGFENWRTWYDNMQVHNKTSASYRVGFKHLFMFNGKLMSGKYAEKQELFVQRENYYWATVAILFAPVVASVRRLDTITFAAIFGVFGFFLLAIATRYYWGVVAIFFLVDRDLMKNRFMLMAGAGLFAFTAFDFFWFQLNDNNPFMYNVLIGAELAVIVGLVGSWLVMNPSLLDVGDDLRLPAVVPAAAGARAEAVPLPTKKKKKKKKKKNKKKKAEKAGKAGKADDEAREAAETEAAEEAEADEADADSDDRQKVTAVDEDDEDTVPDPVAPVESPPEAEPEAEP